MTIALAGMSPLGRRIMELKRARSALAQFGQSRNRWIGLTLEINATARRAA